jgi:dephospho-CoA kinase
MKIVGLTGGIGSGKTTVANWFPEKGIPVYNSDRAARELMNENPEIKSGLIKLFGNQAYDSSGLNRKYISSLVFENKDLLKKLNAIVHPAVFEDFRNWVKNQNAEFVVKEAAILFESGSYRDCDFVVSVISDEKNRTKRVVERDGISAENVLNRMKNQWTDEQRIEKSDFVIYNNGSLEELKLEFDEIFKKLVKKTKES